MYGQLIELIIFAVIAGLLINKLLTTLGSTSESEKEKNNTFFGENKKMKDVTDTSNQENFNLHSQKSKTIDENLLKGLIVSENQEDIKSGLSNIITQLPSFTPEKFIKAAKIAFKMILTSKDNDYDNTHTDLEELVDPRYLDKLQSILKTYGKYQSNSDVTAHISEIYSFGNYLFIKILLTGDSITNKIKSMNEEWTFTKSLLEDGPQWRLTNIDKPQ